MSPGKEIPLGCPHPAQGPTAPAQALSQQGWLQLATTLPCSAMSPADPVPSMGQQPGLTCPCCHGSAQCLVWGCPCAASPALLQAGVVEWLLIAAPVEPPWLWYPALRDLLSHAGLLQNIQNQTSSFISD